MRTILLSAALLLGTLPVAAQLSDSALGTAGELYAAKAGAYGELFPEGRVHGADTPVLALQIAPPGEPASRLLVPGTADPRLESQPALLYDRRSDSVILLWHSQAAGGGLRIDFATRDGDGWSAVQSVTDGDGAAVRLDKAPLTAVTDDAFDLALGDGEVLSTTRRVIHLLYAADESIWYTPLIFVEGAHVGWQESLDLGRSYFQAPAGTDPAAAGLTGNLKQALSLQVRDGQRSVIAAFANAGSGRLGAVEISWLPLDIELLGDFVRDQIFAEAELYDPGDISSFSGAIGAQLIAIGMHTELHPGIVEFAAGQVQEWLETSAADYGFADFESLGNDARELTIYLAGSVSAALVSDPATGGDVLEIDLGDFLEALEDDSVLSRWFKIEVRADRGAPAIGQGLAAIFPSRDGRDLLVGWKPATGNAIRYVESRGNAAGGAWSGTRSLVLGDGLTLEQAVELLQQKIR